MKTRSSKVRRRDGALALAFVNTAADGHEPVVDYADLLDWSEQHGTLSPAEAERLGRRAADRPGEAAAALARARELHALLSGIFHGLADGVQPGREAVEELNSHLARAVPVPRLDPDEAGLEWSSAAGREDDLERPLWPVVSSAGDTLASKARIARCGREGCGALFVASNPGSPRKWCREACGRRVRSLLRYHEKVKPYRDQIREEVDEAVKAADR